MISKMKKTQVFFAFLGFWLPGSSWLRFFVFSSFFVFHFLSFLFLFSYFYHFLRFLHDFLCFAAFSTKKMREMRWRLGKNWWVTSNHRKTKDKMIQKCKKEKIQKWNLFCCIFSTSAHLAFLGSDFSFFLSYLFHFFIISDHFFDMFMDFFLVVQHFRPKDEKHVRIYRYIVTCVYFIFNDAHVSYTFTYIYKRWIP